MLQRHVAITMGSPRFRSIDVGSCDVIHVWFPPHSILPRHTHGRSVFAVMIGGSFDTQIVARTLACTPGTIWTEPAGEPHANRAGNQGAHVLVVQPQPQPASPLLGELHDNLFATVMTTRDPSLALDARRMAVEFRRSDGLTKVALESLAISMFVTAARLKITEKNGTPTWLTRARECVHEQFREPPSIGDIALLVGVDPTHLCHRFRRAFGKTIGEYLRSRRLEWALSEVTSSSGSIASIAAAAGYCDQAHFTRACRQATGMTPAAYRRGGFATRVER